jgi:hypothetical protein
MFWLQRNVRIYNGQVKSEEGLFKAIRDAVVLVLAVIRNFPISKYL